MRETKFIEQNKEKWTEFETLVKEKNKDPDRLNRLFVEITDDLSYSRTFYPNRSVRYYLNGLAQSLFHNIYKNRKRKNRFTNFWTKELPQVIWESRREFLIAFLVFWLAFGIGMLSCAMDIEFPRSILGDSYVEMTERNIAADDPMAVYKQQNEVDMFLHITLNNLQVDFLAFISGIFAGIGTLGVLIYNGIMIGAFQFFFVEKGVFWESFLTVWTHGTIEISTIIISAAAGLVLGKGLIFPGTYSRLQAFQISARRGLKILIGVVPLTILAGFFEGFLTRHTETPDAMRLAIIIFSALFILGYFLVYPWRLARAGTFDKKLEDEKLPPTRTEPMNYQKILSVGKIFKETFAFFNRYFRVIIMTSLLSALLCCGLGFYLMGNEFLDIFTASRYMGGSLYFVIEAIEASFLQLYVLFDYSLPLMYLINTAWLTLILLFVNYLMVSETENRPRHDKIYWREIGDFFLRNILKILPLALLLNAVFFLPVGLGWLVAFAVFPISGLYLFVMTKERLNPFSAISRTFYLLGNGWGKMYGIFIIVTLVGFGLFMMLNTGAIWFYFEMIQMLFDAEQTTIQTISKCISAFLTMLALSATLSLYVIGMGLLYFTLREIQEATGLKERIQSIGKKRRAFGLEVEN